MPVHDGFIGLFGRSTLNRGVCVWVYTFVPPDNNHIIISCPADTMEGVGRVATASVGPSPQRLSLLSAPWRSLLGSFRRGTSVRGGYSIYSLSLWQDNMQLRGE